MYFQTSAKFLGDEISLFSGDVFLPWRSIYNICYGFHLRVLFYLLYDNLRMRNIISHCIAIIVDHRDFVSGQQSLCLTVLLLLAFSYLEL